MANTDLNQLFNNLIPMLLQASRQRKTDDLKERQFQLQQRQGAQDRAFRLKEFEDRNADQLRNEATEADKHKGESYAKLNNDGKLSWINSKVSLPSGFDEATERARIKEEQIEEDRQQTIEDDYNRARIRYTDAEADAIIERNRIAKLNPKERSDEFRRTILQQQMNMAATQGDMDLYDSLEEKYLAVGEPVVDVPEGVEDLDVGGGFDFNKILRAVGLGDREDRKPEPFFTPKGRRILGLDKPVEEKPALFLKPKGQDILNKLRGVFSKDVNPLNPLR